MIEVKSPVEYKNIPDNPGVYLMKNEKGKIIYVGKAKNLRNRVSSYFKNINSHNAKTLELVKNINDIEFFICKTEVEALILENNLIKKNKPKYNILLKDEKTYPYIKFTKVADLCCPPEQPIPIRKCDFPSFSYLGIRYSSISSSIL